MDFQITATALLVASLGSLISLDTVACGQFMISSPLVCCPIVGFLMGYPEVGFMMGLVLSLIWLGTLPVGAYTPPDGPTASITGTLAVCLSLKLNPSIPLVPSVVIGLVLVPFIATLAGWGDHTVYRINGKSINRASQEYSEGNSCIPLRRTLVGLARFLLKSFLVIITGSSLILVLIQVSMLLPLFYLHLLDYVYYAWLGLGLGIVLSSFRKLDASLSAIGGLLIGLIAALISRSGL